MHILFNFFSTQDQCSSSGYCIKIRVKYASWRNLSELIYKLLQKKQNSMYTVRECNKERVFSVGVTKIQPLGSCCRCHQNHHRSPLLYRPWHFLPESYGSEQNHHPVPHFWELLYISWLLHSWHLPKMYNFKTLYTYF